MRTAQLDAAQNRLWRASERARTTVLATTAWNARRVALDLSAIYDSAYQFRDAQAFARVAWRWELAAQRRAKPRTRAMCAVEDQSAPHPGAVCTLDEGHDGPHRFEPWPF